VTRRIALVGASGRMGRLVAEVVSTLDGLEVTVPLGSGDDLARVAEADLVVVPTDRSWKANAHWSAGSDRIQVEAPAVIRAGATYVVTLNGSESAVKVENVPAMLANDKMRTAWLAAKGCEAQAEALLRSTK